MKIVELYDDYVRVRYRGRYFQIPNRLDFDSAYTRTWKNKKGLMWLCDAWFIVQIKITNQLFYKLGKQLTKM